MPISKRLEVRHRQPLALDFRIHLVAIQITPSLPFSLGAEFIQRKQFPQPFKNMNFIFCCTIFVSARKKVCLRQSVTALEGSKGLYSTFLVKSVLGKDWDFFHFIARKKLPTFEYLTFRFLSQSAKNTLLFLPTYQCKVKWRITFVYSRHIKDIDELVNKFILEAL